MIPVTGLWLGKDKNQNQYFSGNLGNARLMIFKNTHKEKENQPDYLLYLDEKKKKDDAGDNSTTQDTSTTQEPKYQAPVEEDDLPF